MCEPIRDAATPVVAAAAADCAGDYNQHNEGFSAVSAAFSNKYLGLKSFGVPRKIESSSDFFQQKPHNNNHNNNTHNNNNDDDNNGKQTNKTHTKTTTN